MKITLNGKVCEIEKENSLLNILNSLNINPQNLIAEINGDIVAYAEFEKRIIYENDIIELVKFVGGG